MSAAVRKKTARKRDVLMVQVAYRLPTVLVERVESWARNLEKQTPGLQLTGTDAVRMLLERALGEEA